MTEVVGIFAPGTRTHCGIGAIAGRWRQWTPLTQFPLQKRRGDRQDHEGRKGTGCPSVSLHIAVWNGVWKTRMQSPSCALRPGTMWDAQMKPLCCPCWQCGELAARMSSSDTQRTLLWPINNKWSIGSVVFKRYSCFVSWIPLLTLLSHPDANLQRGGKIGVWSVMKCEHKLNAIHWAVNSSYDYHMKYWSCSLRPEGERSPLVCQAWTSHLGSKHNWLNTHSHRQRLHERTEGWREGQKRNLRQITEPRA